MTNEFTIALLYQMLVDATRPLSKDQLAERLKLSPKTIERKLEKLQNLGAKIEVDLLPAGTSYKHGYRIIAGKCPCCGGMR